MLVPSQNPALQAAIEQVRSVIRQTPDNILAAVFRNVAIQTEHAAQAPDIKAQWTEKRILLDMCSDADVAQDFRLWVEKTIGAAPPHVLKDFLANVLNGIISTAKQAGRS